MVLSTPAGRQASSVSLIACTVVAHVELVITSTWEEGNRDCWDRLWSFRYDIRELDIHIQANEGGVKGRDGGAVLSTYQCDGLSPAKLVY